MAQTIIKDRKINISKLQREVNLLKSFVIGTIKKDMEGNYNPKFVKKIFQALEEKPNHVFRDEKTFLRCLDKTV